MAPKTILYVEDEVDDVLFMQLAFRRVGLSSPLRAVEDGRQAIAYLSGEGVYADRARHPLPHIILLDLNLPIHSGFEVLQWIRARSEFHDTRVFVFSSSGRAEDRERAHELGATGYLLKPYSGTQFTDIARRLQEAGLS